MEFKGGISASEYGNIHDYIRKNKERLKVCAHCNSTGIKTHFALIQGREYSRNIDDYMELCPSCHVLYDMTDSRREKCRINAREKSAFCSDNHPRYALGKSGGNHNTAKVILQYDLDGKFIKEWKSGTEIKKELGINNKQISSCCRGLIQTSFGYKWRFKQTLSPPLNN